MAEGRAGPITSYSPSTPKTVCPTVSSTGWRNRVGNAKNTAPRTPGKRPPREAQRDDLLLIERPPRNSGSSGAPCRPRSVGVRPDASYRRKRLPDVTHEAEPLRERLTCGQRLVILQSACSYPRRDCLSTLCRISSGTQPRRRFPPRTSGG